MNVNNGIAVDFLTVRSELRPLRITIEIVPGEYRVNYEHGGEATAYYAEDLVDARSAALAMAERTPAKLAPMGPCGRRNTRKAQMYRHNATIAAFRRGRGWRP